MIDATTVVQDIKVDYDDVAKVQNVGEGFKSFFTNTD